MANYAITLKANTNPEFFKNCEEVYRRVFGFNDGLISYSADNGEQRLELNGLYVDDSTMMCSVGSSPVIDFSILEKIVKEKRLKISLEEV
ncbi:hypothetical protein CL617_04205 [archaeon]|nr:hypothetical protein [archaeon]|tara:strand:- start:3055 stop:3324 length:270 start_codon:yes stop_codon:yes gene_type:complete